MKRKWKILIAIAAVVTLGLGVYASTVYSKKGIVTVQTGRVRASGPDQPGDCFR